MKNERFLLLICLFIVSNVSFAQVLTIGESGKPLQLTRGQSIPDALYLNGAFTKGKIETYTGKYSNVPLRYNLYSQTVEYSNNNLIYGIQDSLKTFTVMDSTGMEHQFVKKKAGNQDFFFQVLAAGKVDLLNHLGAKKTSTEDWYTKKQTKTIVHETSYYYSKNGRTEKLTPTEKKLLELFQDKQEIVKNFIEKSKPNLKQDSGLIAVFKFYNSQ